MERRTINKVWALAALAAFGLLAWKFLSPSSAPTLRGLRARVVGGRHRLPAAESLHSYSLPRPRAAESSAQPATAPADHDSPTGNPELDEAYRNNPEWRKRWDRYRQEFLAAQSRHNQPPPPPDPPWVEEERLQNSEPAPQNPFRPN